MHKRHRDQWQPDQCDAGEDHAARPEAVDKHARKKSERQSRRDKAQQETLSHLGMSEPQGANKRWIEDRKAIIDHSGGKEEIQEGSSHDPPAIEDSGPFNGSHDCLFRVLRSREHPLAGTPRQAMRRTLCGTATCFDLGKTVTSSSCGRLLASEREQSYPGLPIEYRANAAHLRPCRSEEWR